MLPTLLFAVLLAAPSAKVVAPVKPAVSTVAPIPPVLDALPDDSTPPPDWLPAKSFPEYDAIDALGAKFASYDMVAWWTSDSVMSNMERLRSRLGPIWFCLENPDWICTYGQFLNGFYAPGVSWLVRFPREGDISITEVSDVQSDDIQPFARAVANANYESMRFRKRVPYRLNPFVARYPGSRDILVAYLPGIEDSGHFVTGVEATYLYDSTGEGRIRSSERIDSVQVHDMDAFTPKTTLVLEAMKSDHPRLGDMYVKYRFARRIRRVLIRTRTGTFFDARTSSEFYKILEELK